MGHHDSYYDKNICKEREARLDGKKSIRDTDGKIRDEDDVIEHERRNSNNNDREREREHYYHDHHSRGKSLKAVRSGSGRDDECDDRRQSRHDRERLEGEDYDVGHRSKSSKEVSRTARDNEVDRHCKREKEHYGDDHHSRGKSSKEVSSGSERDDEGDDKCHDGKRLEREHYGDGYRSKSSKDVSRTERDDEVDDRRRERRRLHTDDRERECHDDEYRSRGKSSKEFSRRIERDKEEDMRQERKSHNGGKEREHYDDGHRSRAKSSKEVNKSNKIDGDRLRATEREEEKRVNTSLSQPPLEIGKTMSDTNAGRSGGVYIPPFRLAQMMKEVSDKSSVEYQRLTWDALRKSINGLVNKINASNIKNIIPELFSENIIRGRGLFCRSCMKSQLASPGFTDVFAALVAVVNTKFPEVGKLMLSRVVLQLKRAYKRNDKPLLLAATKFIAHLVNQQVAHEIISLELLTVLLENPTDDSVEVAVGFVKECGSLLRDLSPQGLHGIFERFRGILHEGEIDKRVQFLIEGLFAIRKAKFQGYPAVRPELDLVEQEDQFTHELSLEDEIDQEVALDIFKPDPQFLEHEKAFEDLKRDILGDESSENEAGSDAAEDGTDDDEESEEEEENMKITDETETNLVNLRRTIYLTIMSSVDFEEAGHKLLKIKLEPGQEMELCIMLLECCSQERTYLRYYGLLGQRFCLINKIHQENFEKSFVQQYSMIHRLETNKLRNVAKFFAHLLGTFALPWHALAYIRLTEEDTTSSSRIFIKILFQELAEHLGIRLLNERLNDPTMQDSFDSIFPKDNPKNTRFSINFFTSIGLGGITESLREYLKNMPRIIMQQQKAVLEPEDSSSASESSSRSETSGSSSASESSSDSKSESDRRQRKRKRD